MAPTAYTSYVQDPHYYTILTSTRFVGKPEGVSNVFLTYFDYFLGGVNTNLGVERHQRGG